MSRFRSLFSLVLETIRVFSGLFKSNSQDRHLLLTSFIHRMNSQMSNTHGSGLRSGLITRVRGVQTGGATGRGRVGRTVPVRISFRLCRYLFYSLRRVVDPSPRTSVKPYEGRTETRSVCTYKMCQL